MDFQKICEKINQCLGEGVSYIVTKEGIESVCISIPSIIDVVLSEGIVKLLDARIEDSDDDIMTILENKYPSLKFFDRTMVLAETQINRTVNDDIKGYVSNGNDISVQKEIHDINVGKTDVAKISINTTNNKSNRDKLDLNIKAVNHNFFSGDNVLVKGCYGGVLIDENNHGLSRGNISKAMCYKLMMCSSDNDIECFVMELINARSTNKANVKNSIPKKENVTNLNKLKKNVKMINQWFFKKSYLVATKKGIMLQLGFKNLLSYEMTTQISEITDMKSAIPVANKMIRQWPSLELRLKDNVLNRVINNTEERRKIIDSINKKAFTRDVLSIVDYVKLVATGSIFAGGNIEIEDVFFVKLTTSKDDFTLMAILNCLSEQYQGISDYLKPNWKMDEHNEYYINNREKIDAIYQELKLSVSRILGLNVICEKLRKYFSVKIVYDAFKEGLCYRKANGSKEMLLKQTEKYFIDLLDTDYMDFDNLNMFLWKCYRSEKSILCERPLFYTNNKLYTEQRGIIQSTLFEEKISELNKILKKDLILTEEGISYDGKLISIDELDVVLGIVLDWNYPDTNGYFEIVDNRDFAKALKITNKDYKFIGSDKLVQKYTKVMEDADIKVSGYVRELMDIPDEYFDFIMSRNDLNTQFFQKDIKDIVKLKKRIEKGNGKLKTTVSKYGYTVELSNPLYEATVVENSSGEIGVLEVQDLNHNNSIVTRIKTIRYIHHLYKNNVKEILEHIDKCVERYRNQFIEKAKMVKVNDDICVDDIICKLPDVSQLKDSCNITVLFDCIKVDGKDVLCTKTGVNLSLREITNLVKRVVSNNMQQSFDTILEEIQNSIKRYDNILHLCKENPAYAAAICLIYDEKDKGITTYKEILKGSKTVKMRLNYGTNKFYGICSNYTLSKIEEMLDYMLECNMLDTKYVKTRKYDYYALVLHHDINDAIRKKIMDVVLDSNCKVRSDVKDMIQNSKSIVKPKSTKKLEVNNIVEYFKQLEDRKKDAVQDVLDSFIVNIETVDVKDGECIDKFIDDNSKYVKDNWDILSKQIPKFDDKLLMYLNLKMNLATSPVKKKAFEVVIDIEKNK